MCSAYGLITCTHMRACAASLQSLMVMVDCICASSYSCSNAFNVAILKIGVVYAAVPLHNSTDRHYSEGLVALISTTHSLSRLGSHAQ